MKPHHIGYLTADLPSAIREFECLGFGTRGGVIEDNARGIAICFMENGSSRIELISPMRPDSTVSSLLKKRGAGPYHICYETDCLTRDIEQLCARGYMPIQPPEPAIAFDGRSVAFLFQKNTGILELVEQ